jgi:hypothetical protein
MTSRAAVLIAVVAAGLGLHAAPAPAASTRTNTPATAEAARPMVTSGPRPGWVTQARQTYIAEGKTWLRYTLMEQADLNMAIDRAKHRAFGEIRTTIAQDVGTATGLDAVEVTTNGESRSREVSRKEIAAVADRLKLYGLKHEETYWEKWAAPGGRAVYHVHVLASIPEKYRKEALRLVREGEGVTPEPNRAERALDAGLDEKAEDEGP